MVLHFKLPLVFEPQPEGGYTVTSPLLPELLTEGDSLDDAMENVQDALAAVLEIYRDFGKPLPAGLMVADASETVSVEALVAIG